MGLAGSPELDGEKICNEPWDIENNIYTFGSTVAYFRDWMYEFGMSFVNVDDRA